MDCCNFSSSIKCFFLCIEWKVPSQNLNKISSTPKAKAKFCFHIYIYYIMWYRVYSLLYTSGKFLSNFFVFPPNPIFSVSKPSWKQGSCGFWIETTCWLPKSFWWRRRWKCWRLCFHSSLFVQIISHSLKLWSYFAAFHLVWFVQRHLCVCDFINFCCVVVVFYCFHFACSAMNDFHREIIVSFYRKKLYQKQYVTWHIIQYMLFT